MIIHLKSISDYLVSLYPPRLFMAQEYKNMDEYCDFRENLRCVFYCDFVDKYLNLEIIKDFDILKKWVTENAKCRGGLNILKKCVIFILVIANNFTKNVLAFLFWCLFYYFAFLNIHNKAF